MYWKIEWLACLHQVRGQRLRYRSSTVAALVLARQPLGSYHMPDLQCISGRDLAFPALRHISFSLLRFTYARQAPETFHARCLAVQLASNEDSLQSKLMIYWKNLSWARIYHVRLLLTLYLPSVPFQQPWDWLTWKYVPLDAADADRFDYHTMLGLDRSPNLLWCLSVH